MADAPEHYVPESTNPQHSTLEPIRNSYKPAPDNEGLQTYYNPDGTPSPAYQTAYSKEAQGYVQPSHAAAGTDIAESGKGEWKKRRICGMSMMLFIALIAFLVLAAVGAIVGGVVGTKSKNTNSPQQVDNSNNLDPTSSATNSITGTSAIATSSLASSTSSSATATATVESQFKSDYWHRLTNNFLGAGRALDIYNEDGKASRQLNMSTTGDFQGQSWQLLRIPTSLQTTSALARRQSSSSSAPQPQYWISTFFLGQDIRLEVATSDSILPKMANADDEHFGQRWWADRWLEEGSWDGTWALSNEMNGRGWNMSTYSDTNELFMRIEKEDTGQHWNIAQGMKISAVGWEVDGEDLQG